MTKVLIENYPHRMGGHCGSGALRDLLEWAGLGWSGPLSEAMVFGLGGGLSFTYTRTPGALPPIYFVGRNGDMELDFCHRLGIDTQRRQTDDPREGWRWVRAELDAGRPVMVWADIADLPYLRVRLSNTRHDIVVVGYDEARQVAWVADNDRAELQEVPLAALSRARGSAGFPGPNRFATYPMRFPHQLPELLPCARQAAASAVHVLRGQDGLLFDVSHLPEGSLAACGLKGIRTFAEDVARWPDLFDPSELAAALRAVPVFVEKAGTGGGMFRRLEAEFCAEVAQETGDQAFARASAALYECARAWTHLATCAGASEPDIVAVSAAAAVLPAAEARALAQLEEAAESH